MNQVQKKKKEKRERIEKTKSYMGRVKVLHASCNILEPRNYTRIGSRNLCWLTPCNVTCPVLNNWGENFFYSKEARKLHWSSNTFTRAV